MQIQNMTKTVTCPDGIDRVGKFTNKDRTNFSVRFGGRSIKGMVVGGQYFLPLGGKNGNPFRWQTMVTSKAA